MKNIVTKDILRSYPEKLIDALINTARQMQDEIYLVGGVIRDWQMGIFSKDLDFTISGKSFIFCRKLIEILGGGTFVSLAGRDGEDAGRVVWKGFDLDISAFRGGSESIAADLARRDFTINCLAADFLMLTQNGAAPVIDPLGGLRDLQNGLLVSCHHAFTADPLRILRGYRLRAVHNLTMNQRTTDEIAENSHLLKNISHERIMSELNMIIGSENGAGEFAVMAENGVLFKLLPELERGVGMEQPDFHHLDVFDHSLEALRQMEKIIAEPDRYFSDNLENIDNYLSGQSAVRRLKWAALFHDIGKPQAKNYDAARNRVTFHNHDQIGGSIFKAMAARLRWSSQDAEGVGFLIKIHMQPFHLVNLQLDGKLSRKAVIRLAAKVKEQLIGLFLLAMSDSLASCGRLKPENMESALDLLFQRVYGQYQKSIRPALKSPRLLSGHDLQREFGLKPGPVFKTILTSLEMAVFEGSVKNRSEALAWIKKYLDENLPETA